MNTSNIIIDPEFKALIPPLTEESREQLDTSIFCDGLLSPLIVWKETGILVDGHNRLEICEKYNKPITTIEMSFDHREQVICWMILNQIGRRNSTPDELSIMRGVYFEALKRPRGAPVGNENNVGKAHTYGESQIPQIEGIDLEDQPTAEKAAKETGVSTATIERDARLVRALKVLGLSNADFAAGRILDDHGKKRTKGSIIEEAFPKPPKKAKEAPQVCPTPAVPLAAVEDTEEELEEQEEPVEEPWSILLMQIPRITKAQRQCLFEMLASKWDCKTEAASTGSAR